MTLAEGTKKGHICYHLRKINAAARLYAIAKRIDETSYFLSIIIIKKMNIFQSNAKEYYIWTKERRQEHKSADSQRTQEMSVYKEI